jgi:hypothetical protein
MQTKTTPRLFGALAMGGLMLALLWGFWRTFANLSGAQSYPAAVVTTGAAAQPLSGYPGPTVQPSTTPTLEPDYSATLVALKTSHPLPTSARPVGICECVDTAMLKMGYDLQNSWQRQINGHWVVVEVGSLQSDPDKECHPGMGRCARRGGEIQDTRQGRPGADRR